MEYFDSDTENEWIVVTKYDLPIEINPFKYDFQYVDAITAKYATNKSVTKLDMPKLPVLVNRLKQIKYSGAKTTYEQEIKTVEYVGKVKTGMIIKRETHS